MELDRDGMRMSKLRVTLLLALLVVAVAGCKARTDSTGPVGDLAADTAAPTQPADDPPAEPDPSPAPSDTDIEAETPIELGLEPGDYTISLRHDGRNRSYIVHVPPAPTVPAPVVIAMHGGGGTGQGFQDDNGLDTVADREGFVAVYPEGTGVLPNRLHTWNSGESCCGFSLDRDIDDVGFLAAVIDDLGEQIALDSGRIYMTGHSNGAMMAYRFAAERADLVTAIVPVGGALDLAEVAPSQSVAMLHIHSLDDPRAIYEGGEGPPFPGTDRVVPHEPVIDGIERWATLNGCDDAVEGRTAAGNGADEGQTAQRMAWSNCDDGGAVEHLLLTGSGHGWPGVAMPRVIQRILGPPTTIIDASAEVWAFASQFDRTE